LVARDVCPAAFCDAAAAFFMVGALVVAPIAFFDGAFPAAAFLLPDARLVVVFFAVAVEVLLVRAAFFGDRLSTVSVPGAGITEVSSFDDQRTRSIEPVTPVTTPSRFPPLFNVRRIRSPTLTMDGTSLA
jgi:hypothetical protein